MAVQDIYFSVIGVTLVILHKWTKKKHDTELEKSVYIDGAFEKWTGEQC